jgi:hypothetical protein
MYGSVFNYVFLVASTVAALGLSYCVGRYVFGPRPSLAAGSTIGIMVGVFIFGVGVVVASKAHGLTLTLFILASFVVTSILVCCVFILRRARQYHSARRSTVSTIAFSVIAVPVLGLWLGVMLTVFLGDGIR